ncbi:MAG: cation diffusion facilitator family transporter [Acidimicrobiaceae bacterium]|nr:cation diffusion facilitator family transporter [Acidimicrobiaceae bacterium]
MANTHQHDEIREASRRSLLAAFALTALLMVAEIVGSFVAGSLSLLAHAGHMLTHVASFGLALFAIRLAKRPASANRTYGYNRVEILAAAANALLMWLVAAYIVWEVIDGLALGGPDGHGAHGHVGHDHHELEGGTISVLGGLGIVVQLLIVYVLSRSSKRSLNVEGAMRHAAVDVLASLALVVSGVLVLLFGESEWVERVDPVLSLILVVLILGSSWQLVSSVVLVLIEGTPEHLDLYRLCHDMEELPGVTLVHDIHVWTVTSGYISLTAHVLVDPDYQGDHNKLLRALRRIARELHGINHSTIQLETSVEDCDEDHHVDHLLQREKIRRNRRWIRTRISS